MFEVAVQVNFTESCKKAVDYDRLKSFASLRVNNFTHVQWIGKGAF